MTYTTIQELRRNCLLLDLENNGNGTTSKYLDEKSGAVYTVVGSYEIDGSYTNVITCR